MMKLKRLEVQGYKTFASRTVFEFDAGITAIVGPNGSGKSNVADAIRWVLGEQSYAALRGKRTADMIFAGSQERARAGMAQAILTLDNSDNWLPIDYTEVEIGRRAYRSGENEYLLNGQKVRLMDVQDLLATSGLAERTYTLVGQGLIDQALSLRSEERRALFEEAAGVSHYQSRRATTLRRLQETERNLERVQDILSEIRPRLGGLKRQANRARDYEQIQTDLRQLLRTWYGYQWQQKKLALRQLRQAAHDAEVDWRESRQRLADNQTQIEKERRHLNQIQRQIDEQRQQREELREKREQARRQVAILSERQAASQRQLADLEEDLPRLLQQQAAARGEMDTALSQLENAQARLHEQQAELQRFQQSFEVQQAEITHWTQTASKLEQRQRQEQKQLSQTEGQLSQLRERLQERQNSQGHEAETAALEKRMEQLKAVVESAQARLDELTAERASVQQQQQAARSQLKQLRREQGDLNREANRLVKEVARLEARCDLLEQMRHKEVKVGGGINVLGQVAGLVEIPKEHQVALEAALGTRLGTLVLQDEATLWQLLGGNGHKETVVAVSAADARPADPLPPPSEPGIIGWATGEITILQADAVVRLLFEPILLVENRQAAYTIGRHLAPGYLAVAPDGFIVHSGGLVESGAREPQGSILAREEAWREAQSELEAQRQTSAQAQQLAQDQQQEIDTLQTTYNKLSGEEQRLGRLAHEATQRLSRAQRELESTVQQRDFIIRQQETAVEEVARLAGRIAQTEGAINNHYEEVVRLESSLQDARLKLEALPIAEAKQQRQTRQQEVDATRTIVAGRDAVVESRRATLSQIEGQLRRLQERRQRLLEEQQQMDLEQVQTTLRQLQAAVAAIDQSIEPLTHRLQQQQEKLQRLEDETAARQRRVHDLETHYTQKKVALSQGENVMEGLRERIKADLGLVALDFDEEQGGQSPLPMAEVVEQLPQVEELPEDIEETIQNYRAQLNRIGAVNPEAPAEYQQTQERYDFLSQQVEDLRQTEKRLRRVIAELDDLTSRAFASTVKKVDGIFGDMFQRLFGGGAAQLVLTEPDDLTISGVDIIARLPSRRQQRLALLSGGERSLTAAALIFALLRVAPPPFCVMDEVDAMLDEANVTRFRGVLRELAKESQVIVITHNRGTVQVAQTVYGISMGNDSASQVISIKPDEYVNQAEPA